MWETLLSSLADNWPVWFLTGWLIVAATIDGIQLKVPNWLTFPMILAGWIYSATYYALASPTWYTGLWVGLGWSLLGTLVGFALLYPLSMIGGMGEGDVKMLMGVGAWVHGLVTFWAFCITGIVGGVLAIVMVLLAGQWQKHYAQFWRIAQEIRTVRDPDKLYDAAAARKSTMRLLPYGIPIAIGSIMYFAWAGMLV
ncbi:MAG: prepilin peptidase [Pirellulaceae bacterium]